jgi:hypothetical protein
MCGRRSINAPSTMAPRRPRQCPNNGKYAAVPEAHRYAELDPAIISRCGTLFAMRKSNGRDRLKFASTGCRR